MDLAERLERFDAAIDDLAGLALDHILLIEGKNDAAALAELGISGDMFCVQSTQLLIQEVIFISMI